MPEAGRLAENTFATVCRAKRLRRSGPPGCAAIFPSLSVPPVLHHARQAAVAAAAFELVV